MWEEGPIQQGASDGALPAATAWVQGVLTGALGTTIAVLAIAAIGLAMLQGHVSARAGIRVVLGCFILFGAPAIAHGLAGLARSTGAPIVIPTLVPVPSFVPPPAPKPSADPYAGASMPM